MHSGGGVCWSWDKEPDPEDFPPDNLCYQMATQYVQTICDIKWPDNALHYNVYMQTHTSQNLANA